MAFVSQSVVEMARCAIMGNSIEGSFEEEAAVSAHATIAHSAARTVPLRARPLSPTHVVPAGTDDQEAPRISTFALMYSAMHHAPPAHGPAASRARWLAGLLLVLLLAAAAGARFASGGADATMEQVAGGDGVIAAQPVQLAGAATRLALRSEEPLRGATAVSLGLGAPHQQK